MKISDLLPEDPVIDQRTQICPCCGGELRSIPAAKTKCPNCSEFIFVRTDPRTNSRRLVTKSEASEIELLHHIRRQLTQYVSIESDDVQRARIDLDSERSTVVSQIDAIKQAIQEAMNFYASRHHWGLYRNQYLDLAEIERRTGDYEAALWHYFDVNYFDLNGADNATELTIDGATTFVLDHPEWNPDLAFIAPAIIEITYDLLKYLDIAVSRAIDIYEPRANKLQESLRMPVEWKRAYPQIFKEIV